MLMLYLMFFVMIFFVIILFSIPFIKMRTLKSPLFYSIIITLFLNSVILYGLISPQNALKFWLTTGKNHYELATELANLGGIEGMISQLKSILEHNPNDAKGWYILSKLFMNRGKTGEALNALKNAYDLEPTNDDIKNYYEKLTLLKVKN